MKIFASILVIFGLLVTLGGVAGMATGSGSGIIRLIVGIVIIIIAIAIRPKANEVKSRRQQSK